MSCCVYPRLLCCGDNEEANPTFPCTNEVKRRGTFMEIARQDYTTAQPHFLPGYTGYTPGTVDYYTGKTYGNFNHKQLTDHRVAGGRLRRIPEDYTLPAVGNSSQTPRENPHQTLEPHFVPGYTGFIPGSCVRRSEGVGQTFGRMTHVLLAKHFLEGGRLRPIYEYPPEYVAEEENVKFYCYEHELTRDDIRRREGLLPGYSGHVPRAVFRHGKTGTKIAKEAIAEFQQIINK